MAERSVRNVLYACFLLSGAAGLIYEVVWARQLTLFLGITAYAHTAVITAYMAGLAAGSLVLGRFADRYADRLRLYAGLEIGVGLYAAATPWLFTGMQSLYAGIAGGVGIAGTGSHLLRFLLAFLALLIPTFLMGGTLPVLVRGFTMRLPHLAEMTGRLYGINTLGATLGTFAAGYLLLPGLGVHPAILLAVLLNLMVAAVVLLLRGRLPAPDPAANGSAEARPAPGASAGDRLSPAVAHTLLIGFAVSGFAALVYEIAWIRALTLVVGSSVYAFSITLTTYLAGLGLGSLLYARILARRSRAVHTGHRMAQAAVLEGIIALSALTGLPLIGRLPDLFLSGYEAGLQENFVLLQILIFGLCFLIMFLPTLLLGALFPLLTSLWTRDAKAIARGVGTAYAANTGGTILGALLGGLLLLPVLGVHNTLLLAAGLHMIVGAGLWLLRPGRPAAALHYGAATAALAVFAFVAVSLPPWDRALMTSGAFVNADELMDREPGESLRERVHDRELLYYREGVDGVVTVEQTETERLLIINGKADASSKTDLPTQVLLGQLPMLMHHDPVDVLVIGLGSGITAGSCARHLSARRIDVLEISTEVVEASRFFAAEHGDVLSDPRVHLIVADARNYVLASEQTYDVISSEPSNPWISGVSNLFTKDFFELARSRLAPAGVMVQWLQTYNMAALDVRTVLRTFMTVFPDVSVWMPMPGDLLLIGTSRPHALDYERLQRTLEEPGIGADLAAIGIGEPEQLFSTFLLGGEELVRYVGDAPLNTDMRPHLEFAAPRSLYGSRPLAALVDLIESLSEANLLVPVSGIAEATAGGLDAPALGFFVRTTAPLQDADWRAGWSVVWRLGSPDENAVPQLTVSGHGSLMWREGEAETRLRAGGVHTIPTQEEDRQLLESFVAGAPAEGGYVELCDGASGRWAVGVDVAGGRVLIGMTWVCSPKQAVHTRYLALHSEPDPGAVGRGQVVQELAARFRCVSR